MPGILHKNLYNAEQRSMTKVDRPNTDTYCFGGAIQEYWYRYQAFRQSYGTDEWDESTGYHIRLSCFEYRVIKHTPKGVWLQQPYCPKNKFVLKNAKKRFAYPTKREALISYIARQKRRLSILRSQIEDSKMGLHVADRMLLEMPETNT
jgi:hypothetical protein